MDLGTVQTLLKAGQFKDISQMNGKIRLVWANCMAYNYEESEIWETAHVLSKVHAEAAVRIFGANPEASAKSVGQKAQEPPPQKVADKDADAEEEEKEEA